MRILYVITDSGVGGAEKALATLLEKIDRKVAEPAGVIVLKKKREMAAVWEKTGVPVWETGMDRYPTLATLTAVKAIIGRVRPDAVHSFLVHSTQVARVLHAYDHSFRLITSPRVNYRFLPRFARWADRLTRRFDDLVICESTATRDFLVKSLGYDDARCVVVPNGVDTGRYAFDPAARDALRREWSVAPQDVLFGSLGRLHDQKGFDIFVAAVREAAARGRNIRAIVAGAGPDEEKLRRLALDAGGSVRFIGGRRDAPQVLSAFDVFVQSSRHEGMSNALLEAMAAGRAIVATAVDGTLDLARDGENMLLVEPNSPQKLASALVRVHDDPALRQTLGVNARATAETFSTDAMVRGFERAYQRL